MENSNAASINEATFRRLGLNCHSHGHGVSNNKISPVEDGSGSHTMTQIFESPPKMKTSLSRTTPACISPGTRQPSSPPHQLYVHQQMSLPSRHRMQSTAVRVDVDAPCTSASHAVVTPHDEDYYYSSPDISLGGLSLLDNDGQRDRSSCRSECRDPVAHLLQTSADTEESPVRVRSDPPPFSHVVSRPRPIRRSFSSLP